MRFCIASSRRSGSIRNFFNRVSDWVKIRSGSKFHQNISRIAACKLKRRPIDGQINLDRFRKWFRIVGLSSRHVDIFKILRNISKIATCRLNREVQDEQMDGWVCVDLKIDSESLDIIEGGFISIFWMLHTSATNLIQPCITSGVGCDKPHTRR